MLSSARLVGSLALSLSLLTLLANCTTSDGAASTVRPDVPYVPQRYRDCFSSITKLPPPSDGYTLAQAAAILADMRVSEIEKATCGRGLIRWADGVLKVARGK